MTDTYQLASDLMLSDRSLLRSHEGNALEQTSSQVRTGCSRLTRRLASRRESACHSRNSAIAGCVAYVKRPATFIVSWLPAINKSARCGL